MFKSFSFGLTVVLAMAGCSSTEPPMPVAMTTSAIRHTTTAVVDTSRAVFNVPGGLLTRWLGPTDNPNYQISNLANEGFIVSHYINTGEVVVDAGHWNQLTPEEKRQAYTLLQDYQNLNLRKPITMTLASAGPLASAR